MGTISVRPAKPAAAFAQEDEAMLFSTANSSSLARGSYWQDVISNTYFPLDLKYRDEDRFTGDLQCWSMGNLSLSRIKCEAILYKRHERQIVAEREKSFLVTIPDIASINFAQDGREVSCAPGGFVLERGDAPYEFSHPGPNAVWVLKVPSSTLRARVGPPERLTALSFDATKGVGAYFVDAVRSSARRLNEMDGTAHEVVGQHLVDLLCMAIQGDERVLSSNLSSVRSAHLFRAEQFIRNQLHKQELLPQDIADRCGISLRYLQRLFTDSGRSICEWIREQRLLMCDEELRKKSSQLTISEIAYNWGFSDQSQFSKHYRSYFGRSPSEARLQYRQNAIC
ncbi:AraC-like DNA-binding protein [Rhizobium leguminosarum]|uniref:AraC-like DNA-binding protein n=2 Tax=Rhizobium TaxID=379 RepID=A0AAE2MLN9_RHILE|nr:MULTISPECIES: helix-turn-helix domain-containing protein [Rhizobium]MBB4291796.1 AraC-like DNA-binding protein [Rhizobium leguminosarum]MBB4298397.1 AraC-like DNA-binding protein [Rhizobium leguminosarum]MBB4309535.1 AraC-like DNA-binding protein [Rhizobium leguminosarum]MBB4418972.1 AraC-like DNA-binding protein [Rhizobium leguminosarum]MBB4433697.1 AraC-like DNA-binding protein [Rhizobium esperanzae]